MYVHITHVIYPYLAFFNKTTDLAICRPCPGPCPALPPSRGGGSSMQKVAYTQFA